METVTYDYNGSNEAVATIHDAVPGKTYQFSSSFGTPQTGMAVTSTLVLTVSDIFDPTPAVTFPLEVTDVATGEFYGACVVAYGTPGLFSFAASWAYDGVNTVTVEAVFDLGVDYTIFAAGPFGFADLGGNTGTGASQTFALDTMDPPYSIPITGSSGQFEAGVYDTDSNTKSERLFVPDVADDGTVGCVPASPTQATQYQRIYGWRLNISDDALETVDPMLTSPSSGVSG